MPKYNDGSALAVLFRLPQADDGLYVVATTDDNDQELSRVFVAQKVPRRTGYGPARYERRPMTERVRAQMLASGFADEQLLP
ncbi:hypothetical protein [Xanthomonas campestris]|uniref:hypothetical protein n=1 Tax=Xanthomonas campestris TaxID=339 RepID=UPI000CBEB526|nr:hypothetical protein [Xanthomonas campestris]MCD0261709.1 hypothetical protein [Xanthomonas campestris pv. campestris]MCD0269917.1 hypothetical protein [Xanthomonas campestris pv. campestris]PJR22807.1 hypothetical protein ASJ34_18305 [Xanthomonas campestris pv. campestris]